MLVGVEAVNAVIAGSADFTDSTGPVFLRANAKGQPLVAIANLIDRPLVEMVLRTDVYDSLHVTDSMSLKNAARCSKARRSRSRASAASSMRGSGSSRRVAGSIPKTTCASRRWIRRQ